MTRLNRESITVPFEKCERAGPIELPPAEAVELWDTLMAAQAGLMKQLAVTQLGGRSCAKADRCVGVTVTTGDCVCYSS